METSYNETKQFQKDWKRLVKKYHSLPEDFALFKKTLPFIDVEKSNKFTYLHRHDTVEIIKGRMACRALRRESLRVIYAVHKNGTFDFLSIDFIELYFKGDKEREDEQRIDVYLQDNE